MRKCIITHNGKEYSILEFKNLVIESGIGGVFSDSVDLAQRLVAKYDFLNQEDSLMEMWAKLEAQRLGIEYLGTETQIQALLQPKGQLTDYATQEQIRYNTYSGINLTGISANFGKVMGYVFETTPISTIYDRDTKEIIDVKSETMKSLLETFKVASPEELVIANQRFAPNSREEVKLRSNTWFRINDVLIDKFSREELKLEPKQAKANIFETIDTVINLAIDNVKEQKLHILGITGTNANSFLNMIGMGIPLKVVSKIFKSPSIVKLNDLGRLSEQKVDDTVIKPAMEIIANSDFKEAAEVATLYGLNLTSVDGNVTLKGANISTKLLDKIHSGKATELEQAISDVVIGRVLQKLTPLNEQMFEYAQIFSLLRGFPNKKWKVDSVINKVEKYTKFEDEENTYQTRMEDYMDRIVDQFKQNSDVYKQILAEKGETEADLYADTELEKIKESPTLLGEFNRAYRANFVSRILRGRMKRKVATPENSVLENSSPLLLPHVYEAYVTLLQFRNIVERLFAVHSPVVQKFTSKILDEASIFSPFDALEKADAAQRDLLKYLSAELQFKVWDIAVDLKIKSEETYNLPSRVLRGHEAWSQKFINEISDLPIDTDNTFLASLEPYTPPGFETKVLRILSDKVNDEEMLERIREDFKVFAKEHPRLAADLFKYNLISNSMFYEKTGFSLIFPDAWAVSFSNALSSRLNTLIPIGQTKTQYNLETIKDDFLFQFVRNNPTLITFPRGAKAQPTEHYLRTGKKGEKSIPYYGGNTEGGYFDLRLTRTEKPQKFVRQYNDDVYMHAFSSGEYDHYIKITERVEHPFYSFTPHQIEDSIDLGKLKALSSTGRIVNQARISNGKYYSEHLADTLLPGSKVYAYDKAASHVTSANVYEVSGDGVEITLSGQKSLTYQLRKVGEVDLTRREQALQLRSKLNMFVSDALGNVNTISDITEKMHLFKKPENILVTNQPLDGVPHIALSIPKWDTRPTPEEIETALRKLFGEISKIDKAMNVFVSADLLTPLDAYMSVKRKIADYLYSQLGYRVPNIEIQESDKFTPESIGIEAYGKRVELGVVQTRSVTLTPNLTSSRGTHTLPIKDLNKTVQATIKTSNILYFGKVEGENTYGYVQSVGEDKVNVTLFNEVFFVKEYNQKFYSPEIFEDKLNNFLKC